ncbi:chemotaxis protein CheB [Desulfuromonas carbonis]|uniref:chemotaxis protein CheB n=1 Tax=Desulfuromonas sp. DDH964 TaxID=1823759 RepID=UPI00078B7187|nr:chemotaxis protein CheB [Desulfuromonas sp. DDH964]AMV73747.1 protein glutamate methyltransferase CheR associated with MCPs of class 44H [Desulfuromonas sp. DDH964]
MEKSPRPPKPKGGKTHSTAIGPTPHAAPPIVGIGASAGGLEALEQFLRQVPVQSGLAFVIVQHLDPTHKGIMPELLQRATAMPVVQVRDRMKVKPDSVYVIPPNKDMSILHGTLHLFAPAEPRGLRLPIDFFFRSLAEDQVERSIGVILSGMGSDGTLGLRAIKEKSGLTLVQEPATARFDSMPRSAIAAGLADLVAPVKELPGRILANLSHARGMTRSEPPLEEKEQSALEKVVILLRSRTGQDFSLYKKNTIFRRIARRMGIHQIDRIAGYVRFLQENPQEVELLFKELLIGVTGFFRDPAAWEKLRTVAIPGLLAKCPAGATLRAWSVGCSTGEEAYSLAMTFREALDPLPSGKRFKLQIFATDLDRDAIDRARIGCYPANIAADVSEERLQRFFVRDGDSYGVGKEIREMVTFATQNVIMDSPFTRLDLVICRNLLIYLTPELQKRLLPLFHYILKPDGILFLGSSESIGAFTELFAPLDAKARLFRRQESLLASARIAFPPAFVPALPGLTKEQRMPEPAANLQSLADQLLLQQFSPPAVLVNSQGDILYISGRTGKYLEPAAGKANWNIFAMAREGLRFDLNTAFQQALRQKEPVALKGLTVEAGDHAPTVDITVQTIERPVALRGMVMIVFSEVAPPASAKAAGRTRKKPAGHPRVLELEQEVRQLREELQSTREEMQSSEEELKSTNEELQSTNEELQSTNEELTTSREEMQSLNEELQTVNAEQQAKMDELAGINDDMRNLLNSTEIATIFLNKELEVRRYTTGANKLFKLIPGDVGRPLSDLASDFAHADLSATAREVLQTLIVAEKEVATTDGHWFQVRIMPYRTASDVIDGVVITLAEITAAKTLERELRDEIARLKGI